MKIHHPNCRTLGGQFPRIDSMIYCILVEADHGLTLIDTGIGRMDYPNPSRLMRIFMKWVGTQVHVEETAAMQTEALRYSISDVRHIVLAHLHLDHAGGLRDFPEAEVHIFRTEYEAGMNPRGLVERAYDPIQGAIVGWLSAQIAAGYCNVEMRHRHSILSPISMDWIPVCIRPLSCPVGSSGDSSARTLQSCVNCSAFMEMKFKRFQRMTSTVSRGSQDRWREIRPPNHSLPRKVEDPRRGDAGSQ